MILCEYYTIQIKSVDNPNQALVLQSATVPCGVGKCTGYLSLTASDGHVQLMEGVTYFMNAMAVNRYGQSDISEKSALFIFNAGS